MKAEIAGKVKALAKELLAVLHDAEEKSSAMTIHVSNTDAEDYMNVVIYNVENPNKPLDTTVLYDASAFPEMRESWTVNINLIGEAVPDASSVE